MTITNNNLQSLLSPSPELSADAAGGIQAMNLAMEAETQSASPEAGEFWSMLNQQLTDITAQNDTQVIENKELLAIFNEFEAELEMTGNSEDLSAKWLQIVNAQVMDESSDVTPSQAAELVDPAGIETVGLVPELVDQGSEAMAMPLLAVTNPAATETANQVAGGNSLPRMRQIAAGLPPITADNPALTLQEADSEMLNRMLIADDPALETRLSMEAQPKAAEVEIDKLMFKQGAVEQPLLTQHREPAINLLTQLQPTATSPAQNLSQLPTPLQTLQLSPQSAATEWGNALGERVSFLINHKLERAEIRIDPPHLGKLDIQIQLKDDSAVVTINTQQANTRDLIDSASFRLREFLQEAGYNSVDVNVSHQQQSMAEQGFDGRQQNSMTGDGEADDPAAGGPVSDGQSVEMVMSVDQGRIDYFA
ncbi:MAG: flagellar hook-length control protein FliK [Gammaproteobacteria bacterium]|nr:flagellar hook-length control protein FliK [Gammaproteobacteria bacterium]